MNRFQQALESCYRHDFSEGLMLLLQEVGRYGTALRKHCTPDRNILYCAAAYLWNIEQEWEFCGCRWGRFDWGLDKNQQKLVGLALEAGRGKKEEQLHAFLELASLFYERK